jgi:microcystin-dependent protein
MALQFDSKKNFAYSLVATAPSPAISGTSLVVSAGEGTKFPTPPFNAVVWPISAQPTTANAEVVRVTNIATDTLTITRAQESSVARSIVANDQIMVGPTAKTLTDIEGSFVTAGMTTCPVGLIAMWGTNSAPTGWLILDGTAISRSTYSELFALWSTTYGSGDGATTFNLPDMRQRIPIGKAAAGTVSTLGTATGSWDHTHGPGTLQVNNHAHGPGSLTVASHTHGPGTLQVASHTHGPGTFSSDSANLAHTHTLSHTHTYSGTTNTPSAGTNAIAGGVDTSANFTNHTHGFSGTTDDASVTTTSSGLTTHSHVIDTGLSASSAPLVGTGVTAATAPAVNAGVTEAQAPTLGAGLSGSNNPPVLTLNFIVRALSTI